MPQKSEPARAGLKRSSPMVIAALAGVLLTGCGEDPNETALREAGDALSARHASTILVDDRARPALNDVVTSLRSVVSDGTKSQQTAANILIARAQQGLAMPRLTRITDLERESMRLAAEIDSEHDAWLEFNAIARAEEVFDPSNLLRENQGEIDRLTREISRVSGEISDVESRVAALEAEAADYTRQAEFEATRHAELMDEALRSDAVRAFDLKKEAHDVRRLSEGLYADADRTSAKAEQIRPEIRSLRIEMTQYEGQRELLERADTDLRSRRANAVAEAKRLRDEAAGVAGRLSDLMTRIVELRETTITPERDDMLRVLGEANRAARSARSSDAEGATLVLAEIVQTRGDVFRLKADADRSYLDLLERLIESEPALPDRASYVAQVDGLRAGLEEAEIESSNAYSEAADLYERGRGRMTDRSSKKRLDSASGNLRKLSGADEELPEEEMAEEPAGEDAPGEAASSDGG